jgi:hypothetical protein
MQMVYYKAESEESDRRQEAFAACARSASALNKYNGPKTVQNYSLLALYNPAVG